MKLKHKGRRDGKLTRGQGEVRHEKRAIRKLKLREEIERVTKLAMKEMDAI